MNDYSTWLESLKPGDEVVCLSGHGVAQSIRKVERVTATQIVVGGRKYRRRDGNAVGDYVFSTPSISPPDDTTRLALRKRALVDRLTQSTWSSLPLEKLEAVAALVWPKQSEGSEG